MSKEAMKLALEALVKTDAEPGSKAWEREAKAITALREALAEQPAQQPTNCRHCGGAANVICAGQCKEQPAQQQESVAALQRVMARLADLLDEDQFAEIEGIVARSGVSPPAQRKPLPFNKEDMEGLDVNQRLGFKLGWKSAEEAHGIKENT